jgi:hypothetical protein
MSTTSITHRPIPMATAAAATVVAVIAFVGVAVSHEDTGSQAPVSHPSQKDTSTHDGKHHSTTAGGRVMIGIV